ncbi:MAG TPA: tripartite tricarboxylate transporter substrate binding protein [Burkholderiales bacterium]|nr:tripartite tricarboxylate transporter substrate binding protein [Burkholderiales bacterium]
MNPMRFLAALALALPLSALSQYPQHAIKLVVPFPPAGATDIVGRIVGQKLGERLGQAVVVENRPGAGGSIGSDLVAKSAPDGYTLLIATSSTHSIGPALQKLPYDPIKDFAAITQVATVPDVLVVSPKLPVANVKELIAYARERPGKLNFASSGIGTVVHLNGEMFKMLTGLDIVHVPYKGTALSIPDLASGNVAILFDSLASAMPNIKAGTVKPLAINAARRSALLPDVPTLAEAGLPAFDRYTWFGMFAPAGTPSDIVRRIQTEVVAALKSPDVRERLDAVGAEPVGSTPEQFVERIRSDGARWAEVIKAANVKVQ